MSKKYLSLEEAANLLKIPTSELMRMREQGEIRGFADRGNWKFKVDDVESMARVKSDDSSPEVPLFADDDDDVAEQPTIISKGASDAEMSANILDDSDEADADDESDVLLVGGSPFDLDDSDSDVKLVGLDSAADIPVDGSKTSPEMDLTGSDSDVRLSADNDSDSDVSLMDSETLTSFKVGDGGSDSDVSLVSDDKDESDVTLMSGEDQEAVPLDLSGDDISVFGDDESGISLSGDSSLMLGGESGISLEGPADSGMELASDDDDEGITLDLGDDSGISLEMDESGISLTDDDSGISLEADDMSNTIPMMDSLDEDSVPETQFEIPPLEGDDDDDVFGMDADETGVLDMSDLEDSSAEDGVFDLDEDDEDEFAATGSFEDDDMDIEDDVFEDDGDLDVFDADDDVFDDEDEDVAYAGGRGFQAAEADWGTGTFVGLLVSSLLMLICGAVMIDLLGNMASASSTNPLSSAILDALGGLYGG
jgi:excisionase family DNA binding protein